MKVYTLVGKSGTGKSYQAITLCKKLNIEGIIDDGLFIYKNRVMAGISAKRQATLVGAIKTALFTTDDHMESVKGSLESIKPSSMLIIGTSDRMVEKIVARLGLPPISERIYIEDLTTPEEREIADKQRHLLGKHVIPVPTLQLKRDFAGYFLDPLKIFRGINSRGKAQYSEKTVVRPTFSYMGDFFISEKVLTDIASCVASKHPCIHQVIKTYQNTAPDTFSITIVITVSYGCQIWEAASAYQREVAKIIEHMTAFNLANVDVEVRALE